jgi:hypothetical protein
MVRGVRTECSVDPSSDKTPALCWSILEPPRRSAKPRRNRRVNDDNRRPRPGTENEESTDPKQVYSES